MRQLAACVFVLFAGGANAAAPGLQDLLAAQAPEDVTLVATTVDRTRQAVSAIEQKIRSQGATQLAMIRVNANYADNIWLLYRLGDKAFIGRTTIRPESRATGWEHEVALAEWEALFAKLRSYRQQRPTPVETGLKLRNGRRWPQGYIGAVNLYSDGDERAYLLATSDFYKLEIQGPVDALLCSTIFSGMHCRMGDAVVDGWLQKDLSALDHASPAQSKP